MSCGRIKLWCEDSRSFESLAPEELELTHNNSQNSMTNMSDSKVFCAAVTFINYLCYTADKSKYGLFEPKTKEEYGNSVKDLPIRIETTDFWHTLNPDLKALLARMLQPNINNRITYN